MDRLWKGLQSTIASRKIDTIEGSGRLVSPTQVRVGDTVYEAEHVVLATGSQPKSLPGLEIDGERVITSDHALLLDRVPEFGGRPWRRRDRGRVRQRLAVLRRRGDDRRDAPPVGAAGGRDKREAAAAGVPAPRHQVRARRQVRVGQAHRHRRHGHARGRQDARRRPAAGRGGPRPGLRRARLRRSRRGHGAGFRQGGLALPDEHPLDLRGRRPHQHAAARARRVRRGDHGRGADRRPSRHPDRLRRRAADHLLRSGGRLGRPHLGASRRARPEDGRVQLQRSAATAGA